MGIGGLVGALVVGCISLSLSVAATPSGTNLGALNSLNTGPLGNGGRVQAETVCNPHTTITVAETMLYNTGNAPATIIRATADDPMGIKLLGVDIDFGTGGSAYNFPPSGWVHQPAVGSVIKAHQLQSAQAEWLMIGLQRTNANRGSIKGVILWYTENGKPYPLLTFPVTMLSPSSGCKVSEG